MTVSPAFLEVYKHRTRLDVVPSPKIRAWMIFSKSLNRCMDGVSSRTHTPCFHVLLLVRLAFHKKIAAVHVNDLRLHRSLRYADKRLRAATASKMRPQQVMVVLFPPASRRARSWHLLPRLLSCTALPGTTLRLAKVTKNPSDGCEKRPETPRIQIYECPAFLPNAYSRTSMIFWLCKNLPRR